MLFISDLTLGPEIIPKRISPTRVHTQQGGLRDNQRGPKPADATGRLIKQDSTWHLNAALNKHRLVLQAKW